MFSRDMIQRRSAKFTARAVLACAAALISYAANAADADATAAETTYVSRADVMSFLESLHTELGFDLSELERIIGEAQHVPATLKLIAPEPSLNTAPSARSYPKYKAKFL